MSVQMTPSQMEAQFRKWHVDLNLYPGWQTRGYGPYSISDVEGVLIHHTGSDSQSDDYLHFLFVLGRGDVPPPLCNWSTDMDGDLWLGAAEKANHAGMGSSATMGKVQTGAYDWRNVTIQPGPDNLNGNTRYYGNEVRFDGGQPMTRAQWITAVLSSAACCDFHHWGAWHVIGHKEHTARKPDPASTSMPAFRRDVDAALRAGPGNWPNPQEVSMSAADVAELKNYIDAKFSIFNTTGIEGQRYSALQDSSNAVMAKLNGLIDVLQGRYIRSEAIHDEDQRERAAILSPLQVLAQHEDVDDALVQRRLDELKSAVDALAALAPKV